MKDYDMIRTRKKMDSIIKANMTSGVLDVCEAVRECMIQCCPDFVEAVLAATVQYGNGALKFSPVNRTWSFRFFVWNKDLLIADMEEIAEWASTIKPEIMDGFISAFRMRNTMSEKQRFVEGVLTECVKQAGCDVVKLDYEYRASGLELVRITYRNGYNKTVDVTGDSLTGIMADVVRYVN